MKENFDFLMPSVNFFGAGVINKIGERAKMVNMKKPPISNRSILRKNGERSCRANHQLT